MKVKITRIDKSLPLPEYHSKGAVACDLIARETTVIPPKTLGKVPGNVIIQIPEGYMVMIAARSSTPWKKGLLIPHGFGVMDQDFCGPEDEYAFSCFNFTEKEVTVERGERIAQLIFVRIEKADWEETDEITESTRGSFGSTGGYKKAFP